MKAVIAISGLAGFAILGPPIIHSTVKHHRHVVHIETHAVAQAIAHADARGHVVNHGDDQCRYEAERELDFSASSGSDLQLSAGSGSLEVVGVEGLNEVRAVARACASHEEFLDDLQLSFDQNGSTFRVGTEYPETRNWSGNRYARLDLRIEVPAGMAMDIDDSSGEISVEGVGDLRIDDSSGEIEVREVNGFVIIDDSSGEISLWDVNGDVEIEDGSGEIGLSGIRGNVLINDGSGEIQGEDVEGNFRVEQDGSGEISVDGIGGDFIVDRDGSGSIEHRNVAGTVDIPRRGR